MELEKQRHERVTEPMQSHLNLGYASDIRIAQLAQAVAKAIGYTGKIVNNTTKPDGSPKKLMSSEPLNALGWKPSISLEDGLVLAYQDFCNSEKIKSQQI